MDTTERGNRGERANDFMDNFVEKKLFLIQIWCWGVENCPIYDRLWYDSFSFIHTTLLWESTEDGGNI